MSFETNLDRERAQIMRAVRQAANNWAQALQAHILAPPDAGFAARLRALADAAASEQVAWEYAHNAGLQWRPVTGADNAQPPYELRPGTGRPGPAPMWQRFDAAVAGLNQAITATNAATVADAFAELSEAAGQLADAIAHQDATAPPTRTRAQGAA